MNRRELFARLAGTAAAAGLAEATVSTVDAGPVLAIIECPGIITHGQAIAMQDAFAGALKGTPFDGIKTLVLSSGMRMWFLNGRGEICNKPAPRKRKH